MSTSSNTSSTDSQMHNNIMAAGSKDRPLMLGPKRYSPLTLQRLTVNPQMVQKKISLTNVKANKLLMLVQASFLIVYKTFDRSRSSLGLHVEQTLEPSQQGVSNDVLVSIEALKNEQEKVGIKGVHKESSTTKKPSTQLKAETGSRNHTHPFGAAGGGTAVEEMGSGGGGVRVAVAVALVGMEPRGGFGTKVEDGGSGEEARRWCRFWCRLVVEAVERVACLDQHAHTLHHLESLLTISLDRLDIFEGRSCISEYESIYDAWTRFKNLIQRVPHHGLDLLSLTQFFYDHVDDYTRMDLDFAVNGNIRALSGEEAWEAIEKFAQGQKEWDNPPNTISEQELANLKAQAKILFENKKVGVEMHRGITWDKMENPNP
ncbi:hypothetical protein Tco_0907420 [Tanacetum coccineum]|uniref:Uncharacterized protein n=1 Tax=Tanacetum coccineum TaxID=301880 RepID=A0ABQ5CKC6_9ASTR